MAKAKKSTDPVPAQASTLFWFFGIILSACPFWNIFIFIPLLIFSKNPTKRNFYKANLYLFLFIILMMLLAIAVIWISKGRDGFPEFIKEILSSEISKNEPVLVEPNTTPH